MAHFFQVFRLLFFLSDTTVFFVFKGMGCLSASGFIYNFKKNPPFPPPKEQD